MLLARDILILKRYGEHVNWKMTGGAATNRAMLTQALPVLVRQIHPTLLQYQPKPLLPAITGHRSYKTCALTPDLLAASNTRIYNAYFDIANFYRDILGDKKGAIGFYDIILKRFPTNPNLPAVYYSMYRLYSDLNDPESGRV